jgi:hypothetical protein
VEPNLTGKAELDPATAGLLKGMFASSVPMLEAVSREAAKGAAKPAVQQVLGSEYSPEMMQYLMEAGIQVNPPVAEKPLPMPIPATAKPAGELREATVSDWLISQIGAAMDALHVTDTGKRGEIESAVLAGISNIGGPSDEASTKIQTMVKSLLGSVQPSVLPPAAPSDLEASVGMDPAVTPEELLGDKAEQKVGEVADEKDLALEKTPRESKGESIKESDEDEEDEDGDEDLDTLADWESVEVLADWERVEVLADTVHGTFVSDYSGRGMSGKVCVGIKSDDPERILSLAVGAGLKGARTDNLGKSVIVYWPHIATGDVGESVESERGRRYVSCECGDPGCPVHRGEEFCGNQAVTVVYRIDMEDETGTAMCDKCSEDALESGVFTTKDEEYEDEGDADDVAEGRAPSGDMVMFRGSDGQMECGTTLEVDATSGYIIVETDTGEIKHLREGDILSFVTKEDDDLVRLGKVDEAIDSVLGKMSDAYIDLLERRNGGKKAARK